VQRKCAAAPNKGDVRPSIPGSGAAFDSIPESRVGM